MYPIVHAIVQQWPRQVNLATTSRNMESLLETHTPSPGRPNGLWPQNSLVHFILVDKVRTCSYYIRTWYHLRFKWPACVKFLDILIFTNQRGYTQSSTVSQRYKSHSARSHRSPILLSSLLSPCTPPRSVNWLVCLNSFKSICASKRGGYRETALETFQVQKMHKGQESMICNNMRPCVLSLGFG